MFSHVIPFDPSRPYIETKHYTPGGLPWGNNYLVYLARGHQRAFVGGCVTFADAERIGMEALKRADSHLSTTPDSDLHRACLSDSF